ncbi:uncharacterized protein I206_103234 [Kwoniella pini CBS 10737]|uniref:Uncharacterized protein n=1 Tax=Kwoniella pini CBS 10737 TaxID=1296096 RepID=A0A1B9IAL7_9TREE|nr:uncharacterized protein I206_01760 [Kwoniella pini CBS 10737]OCF52470.1 hypothetical protein I206_01760 [Kwoniella pini CBS 10737]
MSQLQTQKQISDNQPSNEALSLSASIFLNSIDSWIPKSFGKEIQSTSNSGDQGLVGLLKPTTINGHIEDRLGLGHPDLLQGSTSNRPIQRNGLISLSRKLNLEKKSKSSNGLQSVNLLEDDDEEEDESKFKSISKKKITSIDPFGGSKKRKKDPFSVGSNNSNGIKSKLNPPVPTSIPPQLKFNVDTNIDHREIEVDRENDVEKSSSEVPKVPSRQTTPVSPLPSPVESSTFPYNGPGPFGPPVKSKLKRLLHDDENESVEKTKSVQRAVSVDTEPKKQNIYHEVKGHIQKGDVSNDSPLSPQKLSKTQMRREKRKKAKLSKS